MSCSWGAYRRLSSKGNPQFDAAPTKGQLQALQTQLAPQATPRKATGTGTAAAAKAPGN